MFEKTNQKITQVFTLSTPSKADDFQASDLPGPIRNQTQIKFDKVKWSKNLSNLLVLFLKHAI